MWIGLSLRVTLKDYDETKLLTLDLDDLQRRWESAQVSWFLPKFLKTMQVRKKLRTVRGDSVRPEIATLSAVLKAALRLRIVNTTLTNATPAAETYLGLLWAKGEPDAETLAQIRTWGEGLHSQMAAVADEDAEWLDQFRQLLANLFKSGPSEYAPTTTIGKRLSRYRDSITTFDDTLNTLDAEIELKRSSLDEAADHFGAVAATLANFIQNVPRLRVINGNLTTSAAIAQVHDNIPKAELGLLRRVIAKPKSRVTVRKLLASIPTLLPRLKPCVLMSPLSVAQYLEPSHEIFDVVVFDEASQIPVWDAVGAIARGSQLIVVGDPKQLPPTNFFNTSDDDENGSNDPNLQQDLESILDELMTIGLRRKRLQWHYRSRHEGLITFSNRCYYNNELLTFPSPNVEAGGVKLKYLSEGRYDNRQL
jgi:hypothetical protein